MIRGAGVLYIAAGRALFLKRGAAADHAGEWCLPGGGIEGSESAEDAARREFAEETGGKLDDELKALTRRIKYDPPVTPLPSAPSGTAPPEIAPGAAPIGDPVDFTTFVATGEAFEPKLNAQHVAYAWAPLDQPPEPLHPGCRISLKRVTANELDIARMIASSDLVSPQKYQNVWLFALRISGTGFAYRPKLDEYVLRRPEGYLTDDFLARCNGLPILWQHPPTDILTSDEFSKRVIGTVFLPYIEGDEVWGVAKIYNEEAAQRMQDEQLSTSPGVMAAVMLKGTIEIDNGESTLVVEGAPAQVDHLAICSKGVWDKGQEPQGIRADSEKGIAMANDTKQGEVLDKVLAGIDSIGKRLDAVESDLKEQKKGDGRKRSDAHTFSRRNDGEDDKSYCDRHDAEEADLAKKLREEGQAEQTAADNARRARTDAEQDERVARQPRSVGDSLYSAEMTGAQARADAVYQLFGKQAPAPLYGETLKNYERRLLQPLLKYSPKWKDVDLVKVATDSAAFDVVRDQVFEDARVDSGRSDVAPGELRMVTKRHPVTGLPIYEFVSSDGGTFIGGMKPRAIIGKLNLKPDLNAR